MFVSLVGIHALLIVFTIHNNIVITDDLRKIRQVALQCTYGCYVVSSQHAELDHGLVVRFALHQCRLAS